MNDLILHIEFLLHTHHCVIVPGFGGFVVNYIPAKHDGLSVVIPPKYDLVFNCELTHNDGLLAESFMKTDGISFDNAMLEIKKAVRELKQQLEEKKTINLGNLGSFTTNNESNLVYSPSEFVRPDVFGLPKAELKPIIQLAPVTHAEEKLVVRKASITRRNIAAAVAAVAVIAAIVFVLPLSNGKVGTHTAKLMSEAGLFKNRKVENRVATPTPAHTVTTTEPNILGTSTIDETESDLTEIIDEQQPADSDNVQTIDPNVKRYYIVVGVFATPSAVQKVIDSLHSNGFDNVNTLDRLGRKHIYCASFTDRKEAVTYLNDIRENYKEYHDAWLLKY